jgi:hypothetical protein
MCQTAAIGLTSLPNFWISQAEIHWSILKFSLRNTDLYNCIQDGQARGRHAGGLGRTQTSLKVSFFPGDYHVYPHLDEVPGSGAAERRRGSAAAQLLLCVGGGDSCGGISAAMAARSAQPLIQVIAPTDLLDCDTRHCPGQQRHCHRSGRGSRMNAYAHAGAHASDTAHTRMRAHVCAHPRARARARGHVLVASARGHKRALGFTWDTPHQRAETRSRSILAALRRCSTSVRRRGAAAAWRRSGARGCIVQ